MKIVQNMILIITSKDIMPSDKKKVIKKESTRKKKGREDEGHLHFDDGDKRIADIANSRNL